MSQVQYLFLVYILSTLPRRAVHIEVICHSQNRGHLCPVLSLSPISLPMSPSFSLSVSYLLCLCLSLSFSLSLSLVLSIYLSLFLFSLSLCFSSLSLYLCLLCPLSAFLSISISMSPMFSLSLPLPLSLSLSPLPVPNDLLRSRRCKHNRQLRGGDKRRNNSILQSGTRAQEPMRDHMFPSKALF